MLKGNLKHSCNGYSVWYGIMPSHEIVSLFGPRMPIRLCSLQDFPPNLGVGLLHLLKRDIVPLSPWHLAVQGE